MGAESRMDAIPCGRNPAWAQFRVGTIPRGRNPVGGIPYGRNPVGGIPRGLYRLMEAMLLENIFADIFLFQNMNFSQTSFVDDAI